MYMKVLVVLACLLAGAVLAACGPSQAELDAQATEIAASIFGTQTAEAPTSTFTPTPTPTFTPTSTPTDTPTPTFTPTPAPTSTPTPTPVPPTDTPSPVPPTDTPTPVPPTDTPVPTATPTLPSPQALLKSALADTDAKSHHFEMDMQMKMTEEGVTIEIPMTFVGDYLPPDRMHGMVSMSVVGVTIESEMVTIGETTYVKNPATGQWETSTEPASPYSPGDFTGLEPADIEGLVIVGQKTLDGTPVYHLQGTLSAGDMGEAFAGTEGEMQVEYWIGVKDGLLRRAFVRVELSSTDTRAVAIGMETTVTYSDYGKTLAIEPP